MLYLSWVVLVGILAEPLTSVAGSAVRRIA